jgi:hypothetical protein
VLKRGSIDKYIQQVTAGLPQLERIDTAAELRVHLLQKTRELMAQGFPREEAEHLAVQEMGPVSETNRALLGHIFTAKFGWITLGVLALGLLYLERHRFIWPDTSVREADFTLKEVAEFQPIENATRRKLEFTLPRGTRSFEYAFVSTRYHTQEVVQDTNIGTLQPDWTKPIEVSMHITENTVSREETSFRKLAINFKSKQIIGKFPGTSRELVAYSNKANTIIQGSSNTAFHGMEFTSDQPKSRKLELNKWVLIETFVAEKTKYGIQRPNVNEVQRGSFVPFALMGVQGLAIRANDRSAMQMPRSELRVKNTSFNKWGLIEKPRAGQRKYSEEDSSMDESLRKEIEQRKTVKNRNNRP